MKIEIPGNSPKRENSENAPQNTVKSSKNNNKKKFVQKKSNSPISWRIAEGFVTAIIDRKLIKIDTETFEIHLPNGFKINNNKTLEGAQKKAVEFFSGE